MPGEKTVEKRRHPGHPDRWREMREQEHKAVVRIFLFQAKSPAMIPDDADRFRLNFIDNILIRKGGSQSENQLSPVGGKCDEGESLEAAVRREALEETHLRAIPKSLKRLTTVQTYSFTHKTDKHTRPTQKQRRVYFYEATLLPAPHDVPYVLDPAEDKIKAFERLSIEQLQELLQTGSIMTANGPATMLDSLNANASQREQQHVYTDQDTVTTVQQEFLQHAYLREAEKKLAVLGELMRHERQVVHLGTDFEKFSRLQADGEKLLHTKGQLDVLELNKSQVQAWVQAVQELWVSELQAHPEWGIPRIKQALEHANIRYTLENAAEHFDAATGAGIPTVSLVFPLLFEGKIDFGKYRILQKNSQAKRLLELSQILHHFQQAQTSQDATTRERTERKLKQRLDISGSQPVSFEDIQSWMYREGILNERFKADYEDLAEMIDKYFEVLHREAHITDFSIDQANEVKGSSAEKLISIAFGSDPAMTEQPVEYQRLLRWEAQRKLILLLLVHEANAFRKDIVKRGSLPIDQLEQSLETPDSIADNRVLELAGKKQPVKIERRIKSLMSLLRKLIVRDRVAAIADLVGDTFAEAIVFTSPEAHYEAVTRAALGPITDAAGAELKTFTAPRVAAEYIDELFKRALMAGEQIAIVKFKGLPEPGQPFDSSGAGGGAAVRMVKFYIQHTDKHGVVRQREIQLFVPNDVDGQWQSGEVDYEQKKQDDKDYAVRRLFSTRALRSFMELLYPAEVYGDSLQPIYSAKVKETS